MKKALAMYVMIILATIVTEIVFWISLLIGTEVELLFEKIRISELTELDEIIDNTSDIFI